MGTFNFSGAIEFEPYLKFQRMDECESSELTSMIKRKNEQIKVILEVGFHFDFLMDLLSDWSISEGQNETLSERRLSTSSNTIYIGPSRLDSNHRLRLILVHHD